MHHPWPLALQIELRNVWIRNDWLIPSLKGSFHSETCSLLRRRIEKGWIVWFNRQLCSWKTRHNNFNVLQIYSFINLCSYLFIIQLFIYLFLYCSIYNILYNILLFCSYYASWVQMIWLYQVRDVIPHQNGWIFGSFLKSLWPPPPLKKLSQICNDFLL